MMAEAAVVGCPRDGAVLVEVERNGVTIDACPTCRGIWLDRGELEELIAAEAAPDRDDDFLEEVTGHRNVGEDRKPSGADRKRRRGNLLENFLDFGGN